MGKVNVGVIGCSHIHIKGAMNMLKEHSGVAVKAVWDPERERSDKWAKEVGAPVVDDDAKIFGDDSIQAVVVYTQTDIHEGLVAKAAAAKKHCFVEKPMGLGSADAYRMADAIEKAGVLFQTGYFARGGPIQQFLRAEVQKGNFGKISRVRSVTAHGGSLRGLFDTEWRWMADLKRAGCGGFGDLGTHGLDLLLWIFGEVDSVCAHIARINDRYGETDQFGEGLIRFKSGVLGTLCSSWVDLARSTVFEVSGDEGHAHVRDGDPDQLFYLSKRREGFDGKQPVTDLPAKWPHALVLFLDAVCGKKDVPLVGAREAAYRSSVMEAFYRSAREEKWVKPV